MKPEQAITFSRADIAAQIGGLNGRKSFIDYLERKAVDLTAGGTDRSTVISMIRNEHVFWSALLRNQMKKYDLMRREDTRQAREWVLIHYEFDDLFRYCHDPVHTFDIDIESEPDQQTIDDLIPRIRSFIKNNGPDLPEIDFPLSLPRYFLSGYATAIKAVLSLPRYYFKNKRRSSAFWIKVFSAKKPGGRPIYKSSTGSG